jgi:glycosyltransferase involved in cell wall biosynthesis
VNGARIVVDGYNLLLPRGTGIATYTLNLIGVLKQLGAQVDILAPVHFRPNRKWPDLTEIRLFEGLPAAKVPSWMQWAVNAGDFVSSIGGCRPVRVRPRGVASGAARAQIPAGTDVHVVNRLVEQAHAHFDVLGQPLDVAMDAKADLFHCTYQLPIRVKRAANIYTIHDLIPLRLPGTTQDNKRHTFRLLTHLARHADHIVTVSEHSRRDIIELLGVPEDRVTNTYQAVEIPPDVLARPPDETARIIENLFGLDYQGYFLFFGAIEPKKNVLRLIDAYLGSGVAAPLVVVGAAAWMADREMERLSDPHLESLHISGSEIRRRRRVRHIGYLPREFLYALTQGARAVVFPSLYEGFGLPVLEAMLLGAPVITSNTSSLPEVAGDAAIFVNPYDQNCLSNAIRTLDADADLRAELARRGREQARTFGRNSYMRRLSALYGKLI